MSWQPGVTLDVMEKDAIAEALRFYGGNRKNTANALGIAVRTLFDKMHRYGLDIVVEDKKDVGRKQESSSTEEAKGVSLASGVHAQPTSEAAEKSAMSVSKRHKVQKVLSA